MGDYDKWDYCKKCKGWHRKPSKKWKEHQKHFAKTKKFAGGAYVDE